MSTLKLVLTHHWYDMIESGVKKQEYRTIKGSIVSKLFYVKHSEVSNDIFTKSLIDHTNGCPLIKHFSKSFDKVEFARAYDKNRKIMTFEIANIDIGTAVPEWSDNWPGNVFRIHLGKKI